MGDRERLKCLLNFKNDRNLGVFIDILFYFIESIGDMLGIIEKMQFIWKSDF